MAILIRNKDIDQRIEIIQKQLQEMGLENTKKTDVIKLAINMKIKQGKKRLSWEDLFG